MGHGKNTTGDCREEKRRTEPLEQGNPRLLLSAVGLKYIGFGAKTGGCRGGRATLIARLKRSMVSVFISLGRGGDDSKETHH